MPACSRAPAAAPLLPSLLGLALPCPCQGPLLVVPETGLSVGPCSPPGPCSSRVKGAGLVVLQDKIVCQGFVGGSLADAGRKTRKTSCKDGKRRREKTPQGKHHCQETKSSSSVKGTVRLRQTCTAQVMSCIKNPPCPTHSGVLHLPGQPVLGAREFGRTWDSPPTPHGACKPS